MTNGNFHNIFLYICIIIIISIIIIIIADPIFFSIRNT